MIDRVPELRKLPAGLVLDSELVELNEAGAPDWPLLCGRMLHGNTTNAVTFFAFDVLRVDGNAHRLGHAPEPLVSSASAVPEIASSRTPVTVKSETLKTA